MLPGQTYASVTDQIADAVLKRPSGPLFFLGLGITTMFVMGLTTAIGYIIVRGVGIWGINQPHAWGFAIVNFVWWIGIGHAGTFISAMLLLMRQHWRTSINRFAEAMTLFAVACAGMYPLLHLGRIQYFYWLMPYPNTMGLWPQFRSALVWDVFAVSTYGLTSLLFWYVGLMPDFATMRDKADAKWKWHIYAVLSLGWRGAGKHWQRYQALYLLLAGICAPLVISVHSIVGMDFAQAHVPGWHSTIFPPYFVAGAIFSGFAMVLTLMIPLRAMYKFKNLVTMQHIDKCCKLMLVTGMIVTYGYGAETFTSWYSGIGYEGFMVWNRFVGPYWPAWWGLILCNCVIPQLLWFKWVRMNLYLVWVITLVINVGMWLERYVIVVISLHRDFLPSSWGMYYPTIWDWATYLGTIGLFLTFILLFIRVLPAIAIAETRELVHETHGGTKKPVKMEPAHVG
jgi:molybdopterin-containing oxidoreductase family membrane subunit